MEDFFTSETVFWLWHGHVSPSWRLKTIRVKLFHQSWALPILWPERSDQHFCLYIVSTSWSKIWPKWPSLISSKFFGQTCPKPINPNALYSIYLFNWSQLDRSDLGLTVLMKSAQSYRWWGQENSDFVVAARNFVRRKTQIFRFKFSGGGCE